MRCRGLNLQNSCFSQIFLLSKNINSVEIANEKQDLRGHHKSYYQHTQQQWGLITKAIVVCRDSHTLALVLAMMQKNLIFRGKMSQG